MNIDTKGILHFLCGDCASVVAANVELLHGSKITFSKLLLLQKEFQLNGNTVKIKLRISVAWVEHLLRDAYLRRYRVVANTVRAI